MMDVNNDIYGDRDDDDSKMDYKMLRYASVVERLNDSRKRGVFFPIVGEFRKCIGKLDEGKSVYIYIYTNVRERLSFWSRGRFWKRLLWKIV